MGLLASSEGPPHFKQLQEQGPGLETCRQRATSKMHNRLPVGISGKSICSHQKLGKRLLFKSLLDNSLFQSESY